MAETGLATSSEFGVININTVLDFVKPRLNTMRKLSGKLNPAVASLFLLWLAEGLQAGTPEVARPPNVRGLRRGGSWEGKLAILGLELDIAVAFPG